VYKPERRRRKGDKKSKDGIKETPKTVVGTPAG
jgi:hypothetical protein